MNQTVGRQSPTTGFRCRLLFPGLAFWLIVPAIMVLSAGCEQNEASLTQCHQSVEQLTAECDTLRWQAASDQQTLSRQKEQIETLRGFGQDRLLRLYFAERLEIADLSGGYDTDGRTGDEGVVVYLRPRDADGDIVKAAGAVVIKLFDLAEPEGGRLLGSSRFSPEEIRERWHSRFLTQHFTLKCPFESLPAHEAVTVRVEFSDLLTGKTLIAEKLCQVRLSPVPGR